MNYHIQLEVCKIFAKTLTRASFLRLLFLFGVATRIPALDAEETAGRPRMTLTLDVGKVVIELRPDKAPLHVARIRELANSGFYDGLTVVRVAPGHVVQAGDPKFDGTGGSGRTIKAEFSDLMHLRGAVGMARDEDPDSGDSQFYICLADRPHLDGHYTVFGQVVSGMDVLDALTPGDGPMGFITDRSKQPRIVSVRVSD
jgi:peptidylprolyl isomerase